MQVQTCSPAYSSQQPFRPRLEVADILALDGPAYRSEYADTITVAQERVLRELPACRTSRLGGHKRECDACAHPTYHYNSCNNRHCPKCQEHLRQQWRDARLRDLLPVEYFHVTFTLPDELARLARDNPREVYNLLFQSVSNAISMTAAQWSGLRAEMGFTAVLHSWGELLNVHPHLHCLVPGGGVSLENGQWVDLPRGFFLPQGRLRTTFRDTYLKLLERAYERGELKLVGEFYELRCPEAFAEWIARLRAKTWITHDRPLVENGGSGDPASPAALERTVGYLARYANRVAIANSRLIAREDGDVLFWYKDYRDHGRRKTCRLPAVEFIQRFLQHVLPHGMRHIRHYGFMSANQRRKRLPEIRKLLGMAEPDEDDSTIGTVEAANDAQRDDAENAGEPQRVESQEESDYACPVCKKGRMIRSSEFPRPTVAELLAIPWRELTGAPLAQERLVQEQFF